MGQYHSIYNRTKKEYFSIGGAKLWEQAHDATAAALLLLLSNSNGRGGGDFMIWPKDHDKLTLQEIADQAIIDLVSGRWAGDSIVVQGDYVESKDPGYIDKEELNDYKSITVMVAEALLITCDGDDECKVVSILEGEASGSYGAFKNGFPNVRKIKCKDRNNQDVEAYHANVATPKPKRKTKAEKQAEEFEKQLALTQELAKKQGLKLVTSKVGIE